MIISEISLSKRFSLKYIKNTELKHINLFKINK